MVIRLSMDKSPLSMDWTMWSLVRLISARSFSFCFRASLVCWCSRVISRRMKAKMMKEARRRKMAEAKVPRALAASRGRARALLAGGRKWQRMTAG
jgi:hypothetical protein